ncbi:ribosome small subunit-dependent GTPase A [Aliiruegeria sabulilitoris]|uniref:ribosome small subunit-dependent GTPase A n=1 Tax=Aliiruegeria sabulilitoris TaxID=1510458 RepID=UPI00082A3885|nr:ribosome small subunit-dependent GTPase A [Aliiruegeria sabulilitoris]NDR57078.1 ribosome small subunit-dependent GTPase A [Pseudoruegeria sp. M32A2M]
MNNHTLSDLGWSAHFRKQCLDATGTPARISSVARDRLEAIGEAGIVSLSLTGGQSTGEFAVGDWVLHDDGFRVVERLEPKTRILRKAAGREARSQLIAANVDTLGIVSSCNADFNEARLERYLALAESSGCLPLVILTKADEAEDPVRYRRKAERLSPLVSALTLNALDPEEIERLAPWCSAGQTLALVGSSGVGKTTLSNGLTGRGDATMDIREDDSKGRHTTTSRALYATLAGGWLIDTPGMRELQLTGAAEGIDAVFADITELATSCKFSDCNHHSEPGCAVRAEIDAGRLEPDRLARWEKLQREDARNSESISEAHSRDRRFGKMVRSVVARKRQERNTD